MEVEEGPYSVFALPFLNSIARIDLCSLTLSPVIASTKIAMIYTFAFQPAKRKLEIPLSQISARKKEGGNVAKNYF